MRDTATGFAAALRKHGVEAFDYTVLEEGLTRDEAYSRERYYIASRSTRAPNGYNISDGGAGGVKHREETTRRISDALRNRPPISDSTRAKRSAALKGKKRSDAAKAKLAAARRGTKASAATKDKLSAARKGGVLSETHKQKIADAARRRWANTPHERKLAIASAGRAAAADAKRG